MGVRLLLYRVLHIYRIVRKGLQSVLEMYEGIRVVGEAASGEELLQQIEAWLPDVVVMDMLMPGGIDGIETIRRLRALTPGVRVAPCGKSIHPVPYYRVKSVQRAEENPGVSRTIIGVSPGFYVEMSFSLATMHAVVFATEEEAFLRYSKEGP